MPEVVPIEIEAEFTSLLGQLVIKWSAVEDWLAQLLATLVDADPGAMSIVTGSAGAATLIQWIQTTLSVHEPEDQELKEISDFVQRAEEMRTDRNALVHGIWDQTKCESGTCIVVTFNWKHSEIIKEWLITTTDLKELISGIDEWIADYIRLGRKFNFPRRRGQFKSIFAD